MISLISIGVEIYKDSTMCEITCAYNDALNVYSVFDKVFENSMQKHSSTALKNITALECRNLFSTVQLTIEKQDTFVFYFSGHGITTSNGKLKLAFADYDFDTGKGSLSISEIVAILSTYGCKVVLILDCCYSGAAIVDINTDDVNLENNISLLASGGSISQSSFSKNGSDFTNYFIEALEYLFYNHSDISLDKICEEINKKSGKKCKIVTGGGCPDLLLMQKSSDMFFLIDFDEKFIEKIESSNYEIREALWYKAEDFPEAKRIEILSKYMKRHDGVISEMSWRVRRCIGSICRRNITKAGKELIYKLLSSENWADRCIGYICTHHSKEDYIKYKMLDEVKCVNPMDLIWLIVLYLSEQDLEDYTIVLDTSLLKTSWGALEVWKRYYLNLPLEDKLKLFESKMNQDNFTELCIDLSLRKLLDNSNDVLVFGKYINKIEKFYLEKKRGSIKEMYVSKWVYSTLYGNWRDQINLNEILKKQIDQEVPKNEIGEYLNVMRNIPSVEIKMAILDFFVSNKHDSNYSQYKSSLKWALYDKHPWVIRAALPLFENEEDINKIDFSAINTQIYPGVYDLLIELKKYGASGVEKYDNNYMTRIEKERLENALNNE